MGNAQVSSSQVEYFYDATYKGNFDAVWNSDSLSSVLGVVSYSEIKDSLAQNGLDTIKVDIILPKDSAYVYIPNLKTGARADTIFTSSGGIDELFTLNYVANDTINIGNANSGKVFIDADDYWSLFKIKTDGSFDVIANSGSGVSYVKGDSLLNIYNPTGNIITIQWTGSSKIILHDLRIK